jgi:hypothetical protein
VLESAVLRKIFWSTKKEEITADWRNCTVTNFGVFFTNYYSDDKINEHEIGRACGIQVQEKIHPEFWQGSLREKDRLEY